MPDNNTGTPGAIDFIRLLFQGTERPVYFSSLANDRAEPGQPGERNINTRDPDDVARFVAKWDRRGRGTFFCVATIEGGTRNKDAAREIPALWCDVDYKGVDPGQDVGPALARLRYLPSLIVSSGHGAHLYYLLKEPLDAQADQRRAEAVLRQLADMVAGDLQVCEVARLMRLPGTHNTKGGEWKPVTAVQTREDPYRYTLEELEDWLAEAAPVLRRRPSKPGITMGTPDDNPWLRAAKDLGYKPRVDVAARLEGMSYGGTGEAGIHATQLSVSAALLNAGQDPKEVVALLLEATAHAAGDLGARWDWRREEAALRRMCVTWLEKHPRAEPTERVGFRPGPEDAQTQPEQDENVIDLGAARAKRKAKAKAPGMAAFAVADGVIGVLRAGSEDILLAEGEAWLYRDGFWRVTTPTDEQRLRALIQQGFEELGAEARTSALTSAWKRLMEHPGLYRPAVPWAAEGWIVCRNGVLRVDRDGFLPHSPENYARRHIGAAYDPAAACPMFETLLASMFADREDASLAIELVREWLGAALAIDCLAREARRALILVGPSRTGKTELARIVSLLLGDPVSTASVAEISERFGLASLYGAVAWIRDDAINEGDKLDPQRFKTIVTGEPVNIERKNRDALPGVRLNTPVLLTANSLPRARDGSDAIFNRSIVLYMTNVVEEDVAAAARAAILGRPGALSLSAGIFEAEASGILNWALVGLRRLWTRGRYDIPASVHASILQFKDDNNPVAEWSREAVEEAPYGKVDRRDLVRSYNGWELEREGDEARAHGGRWLLPKLRSLMRGLGEMQAHNGQRYITGVKLTDAGLATWESYGKASPRNGPGGSASFVSDVNQVHAGKGHNHKEPRF